MPRTKKHGKNYEVSMTQTAIKIASDACLLLGASPIQSFDEGTVEAQTAKAFYEETLITALSHSNWSFAKRPVQLVQLDKQAAYGYKYVYRVSEEVIKIISLNDHMNQDYRLISGRELHTSIENPFVVAIVKVNESELPAAFTLALKHMLAAMFCSTITDDSSQAERFERKGQMLLKKAAFTDQTQQPVNYIKRSDLINVRY